MKRPAAAAAEMLPAIFGHLSLPPGDFGQDCLVLAESSAPIVLNQDSLTRDFH